MSNFKITKTNSTRINDVDWDNLGFGVHFSDHIFESNHSGDGWDAGEIKPYGPMPDIEPANCTLHYSQTIFEGLKAFRDKKSGVNIFRPDRNAARLNRSASRLVMPEFDESEFIAAMQELIRVDADWLPKQRGHALYIRPFMFGMGNFLGVHASESYRFIIMTSPVSSYFKEGLNPVKIKVEEKFVRAVRGGTGKAKAGGNYASSMLAAHKAKEQGFSQVLWLDGVHRKYVDEVGAMNIMFVIDGTLVTPTLEQGSILEGVTRESVLILARDMGIPVEERKVSIDDLIEAHGKGKLQEVFGCGTAAVISPVGMMHFQGKNFVINDSKIGPITQNFYDTITGIQYGELEDKYNWNVHFEL